MGEDYSFQHTKSPFASFPAHLGDTKGICDCTSVCDSACVWASWLSICGGLFWGTWVKKQFHQSPARWGFSPRAELLKKWSNLTCGAPIAMAEKNKWLSGENSPLEISGIIRLPYPTKNNDLCVTFLARQKKTGTKTGPSQNDEAKRAPHTTKEIDWCGAWCALHAWRFTMKRMSSKDLDSEKNECRTKKVTKS